MSLFKKYPEMNVTLCESKLSTFSLVTAKRPSEQKKQENNGPARYFHTV